MQYHFDGFKSGDPQNQSARAGGSKTSERVDVIIVGCGPAGLTLATQLAQFPDLTTRIFEQKSGPLSVGQADGLACRSLEMFQAFGMVDKVLKEAYFVNETTFWRPDPKTGAISRADRVQDVEDDLSHQPHVILSQARIQDFYLEMMAKAPSPITPDYGQRLLSIERDDTEPYPIKAVFSATDNSEKQTTLRAKFLVGCDGARSTTRQILGYPLIGQSARQLWGVMDILANTTFPDIRYKCAIQSNQNGSLLIIPREGGYMVRLYIELDALKEEERASDRGVTPEMLIEKAQAILSPYTLDVKEVAWWSAYEIGQRLCSEFDDAKNASNGCARIFITGDACHTHSPKAGQGMNVSMADAFNLGWKLANVLKGQIGPELLSTYASERHAVAEELIAFDRDMARLFSESWSHKTKAFQSYFQRHGRFTAGVETRYKASMISLSDKDQSAAKGLIIGKRFHSTPVTRLADAYELQISSVLHADGRWRIFLFAGSMDDGSPLGEVAQFCDAIRERLWAKSNEQTHIQEALLPIDVYAIFQHHHHGLNLCDMHEVLRPRVGRYALEDSERVFCAPLKSGRDIYEKRGIDREQGAVVLIRPDQHIAFICALPDKEELFDFLRPIFQHFN